MLYEMMTLMNFLSFPAIDFDFIWSRHMTWVTSTTAQPKQPLATRLRLAGIIARREIEKFACEKFLARNKVREMREIHQGSLGLNWAEFYTFTHFFHTNLFTFCTRID